jgi:membrane-associated phospholipid phosphatase
MNPISKRLYIITIFTLCSGLLSYIYIDKQLALFLHGINYPSWFESTLFFIENWTKETRVVYIMLLLTVLAGTCVYQQKYEIAKKLIFIILAFILTCLITLTIKIIVARTRPDLLFSQNLYGLSWFSLKHNYNSMPSGHTSASFAIALSVVCIIRNKFISILLVCLAICVALDRILIIHHYLSDVLIGVSVSSLCVGLSYQAYSSYYFKLFNKLSKKK